MKKSAWQRILTLLIVALVAVSILPTSVSAADYAPTTGAELASMIGSASAGDVIMLNSGTTYQLNGTIIVASNIVIEGNGAVIKPSASFSSTPITFDGWRTAVPLLYFTAGGSISDVTLQGPGGGAGESDKVTAGIMSNSGSGNSLAVSNVNFLDIRDEPLSGMQRGHGLVVQTGSATVDGCYFEEFQKTAVFSITPEEVTVSNTEVKASSTGTIARNGITVLDGKLTVKDVEISGLVYNGSDESCAILLSGADNAVVDGLTVTSGDIGVYASNTDITVANSSITTGNLSGGDIYLGGTSSANISNTDLLGAVSLDKTSSGTLTVDAYTVTNANTFPAVSADTVAWADNSSPTALRLDVQVGGHSVDAGGVVESGNNFITVFGLMSGVTYTWTTSDAAVATGAGMAITPVAKGSATLTLKVDWTSESKTYTYNVTVFDSTIPDAEPTSTGADMTLNLNNSITGTFQVTLGMSSDSTTPLAASVDVTSSDSGVATASIDSSTGVVTVTAVGKGTATISARFFDAAGQPMPAYDVDFTVTVTDTKTIVNPGGGSTGGGSNSGKSKPADRSPNSSGGGGGGAGGGGLSSAAKPANAFTLQAGTALYNKESAAAPGSVALALKARDYDNASQAVLNSLAKNAADKGNTLTIHFDTMTGNAVTGRLTVAPAAATKDISTTISVSGAIVDKVKEAFGKWYSNKIVVIHTGQKGSYGMNVNIAAKTEFTEMETGNLYFYSYDRATGSLTLIAQPNYRIDGNGYLHFTTGNGDTIIVSDGPLARK
ncbi:MAG: hypothetical protein ACK5LX_05185 [Oscillospiraceae bacterium]